MKKTFRIASLLTIMVSTLLLTSCDPLKPVINKAYGLTVKVEQYVADVETTELVAKVDTLKPPLNILIQAINYIEGQTSKKDVKTSLGKISDVLETVVLVTDEVTDENVEAQKQIILNKIAEVKVTIEEVAKNLNINISTPRVARVTLDMLATDAAELEEMIKKD